MAWDGDNIEDEDEDDNPGVNEGAKNEYHDDDAGDGHHTRAEPAPKR